VLVSSHLVSEIAQVAAHLVVITRGRLVADTTVAGFVGGHGRCRVLIRSPHVDRLAALLAERGLAAETETEAPDILTVTGIDPADLGEIASNHGLTVHELTTHQLSLEDAFIAVTGDIGSAAANSR
jgi:ABC-2 type transport system ATP-binding protein